MTPETTIQTAIQNAHNKPIIIKSGEFKGLNNQVLAPGEIARFSITIPEGYAPLIKEFQGPGPKYQNFIMVSLIASEFYEGNHYNPML